MLNPKRVVKGIGIAALCCFAVYYIFKQVIGFSRETVETEFAMPVTYENTLSATGYIVRSESVLKTDLHGAILATVSDGEKVSAGMEVANVYQDFADTTVKARMDEIDRKVRILESSTVDQEYFSADVAKLEKDKNETLDTVRKSKSQNDLSDCVNRKTELLVRLNKLSAVKNGTSFDEEIQKLEKERVHLTASAGNSYNRIFSASSGYYYSVVDGYENTLLPSELSELDYNGFYAAMDSSPDETLLTGNAGKIVTDSRWYVLCALPRSSTAGFETGKNYTVIFPYAQGVSLKMKLFRMISETDRTEDILILTSNDMPEGFSYTRMQKVQIVSLQVEGLKIPRSAIRMLPDGTKGVYVLTGDKVIFKRAEEIYRIDESYIIRYESDEEKNADALENDAAGEEAEKSGENADNGENTTETQYPYLSLYDNVIVGGKMLYDGKRIG